MHFQNSNNDPSHNESIISQFTKEAIHFTKLSEHSNQYGYYTLMYQMSVKIIYMIFVI